jgi:hypothetical protein
MCRTSRLCSLACFLLKPELHVTVQACGCRWNLAAAFELCGSWHHTAHAFCHCQLPELLKRARPNLDESLTATAFAVDLLKQIASRRACFCHCQLPELLKCATPHLDERLAATSFGCDVFFSHQQCLQCHLGICLFVEYTGYRYDSVAIMSSAPSFCASD